MHEEPPILFAVRANDYELVKKRINLGLDINYRDRRGENAINVAARLGNLNIISLLLENGADPWALDGDGRNAFQCGHGNSKVLAVLHGKKKSEVDLISLDDDDTENSVIAVQFENQDIFQLIKNLIVNDSEDILSVSFANNKLIKSIKVNLAYGLKDENIDVFCIKITNVIEFVRINEKRLYLHIFDYCMGQLKNGFKFRFDNSIGTIFELAETLGYQWEIFIGQKGSIKISIPCVIDGEHDLHLSLGINKFIKSIWIE